MAPASDLRLCLHHRLRRKLNGIGNPNPRTRGSERFFPRSLCRHGRSYSTRSPSPVLSSSSPLSQPIRYAVLGAGFAGLSVAWHLLEHSPRESSLCIDLFDEVGIGGGASGAAGGLIHPYSPKGKLLWRGAECWEECLKLLVIAERAANAGTSGGFPQHSANGSGEQIVWRRGILRPATTMKNADILRENAQSCLGSCRIEILDKDAAQNLIPDLSVPFNLAIHMPLAVNIHPKRYLQLAKIWRMI